jgi:ribosomal protein S18 acetylase RimI-like enzyme
MPDIRRANLDDAAGIAEVIYDVWRQTLLDGMCRAHVQDATCALWVAEERDDVVGFVSAFLTTSRRGERRWEIDLVAVRPDSQGRGLGPRLIAAACEDGRKHQVALARALIRVDNVPSQRAFEKVGFATDGEVYRRLLWRPETGGVPERTVGIPVDTLIYRGLWVEGLEDMTPDEQHAVVSAARSRIAWEARFSAGALIPTSKKHRLAADRWKQAMKHNEYHWFVKPMLDGICEGRNCVSV